MPSVPNTCHMPPHELCPRGTVLVELTRSLSLRVCQVTWLVTEAQIAPGNAKKYAPKLIAAGVASAEILFKKFARQE